MAKVLNWHAKEICQNLPRIHNTNDQKVICIIYIPKISVNFLGMLVYLTGINHDWKHYIWDNNDIKYCIWKAYLPDKKIWSSAKVLPWYRVHLHPKGQVPCHVKQWPTPTSYKCYYNVLDYSSAAISIIIYYLFYLVRYI